MYLHNEMLRSADIKRPVPPSPAETVPPSFIQRLQSSTVRQGSQVRLDVRVTGIPAPVVKFYREGAEIQSSTDFRIIQDGDLHSLLIAEAFPEDSGTYSVTATNSSGRATSTAELLVQGKNRSSLLLLPFGNCFDDKHRLKKRHFQAKKPFQQRKQRP